MGHEQDKQHMQIGAVAERTGLSLRTIRYYEEVGLVTPSARTSGGFRLYTEADVARLRVAMGMKPLGFSLEEMRELMEARDAVGDQGVADGERAAARERLASFQADAEQRCATMRRRLNNAEAFAQTLQAELDATGPA
ncbi:MerR family transcriptional regulator [Ruania alkalisoli]|uniref:MerR family transcriptional regulator n=1 Tax=Ruania alkalisoli TaxID=2779775 RepID=A0A7M1SQG6_9MICO|nr:MerR family transcriptional regulator [Ruania alkalisoli]QOR69790.1 MerR family transcriptional regulator [Ruania alkalisoli]